MVENIFYAQGEAKPATPEDIEKDTQGITEPNLHRRIDEDRADRMKGEVEKDHYTLSVQAVNSYRTTKHNTHDEESTVSEIP